MYILRCTFILVGLGGALSDMALSRERSRLMMAGTWSTNLGAKCIIIVQIWCDFYVVGGTLADRVRQWRRGGRGAVR